MSKWVCLRRYSDERVAINQVLNSIAICRNDKKIPVNWRYFNQDRQTPSQQEFRIFHLKFRLSKISHHRGVQYDTNFKYVFNRRRIEVFDMNRGRDDF